MLKRGTDRSEDLNCKQVSALLGAYREGGLPVEQADAVAAHLDACLDCRRAASLDAEVASRLRMEAAWQRRRLSPRAAARIQQRLYGRMRRSMMAQRVSRFVWGAVGLALLAAVVFGGYAWWQQRPVGLNVPAAGTSRTPSPRMVGLEATAEAAVPRATPSLPPVPTTTPTRRVHEAQPGSLSTRDPKLPIPNEPSGTRTPGPTATARSSPTPVPTQRQPEILSTDALDCTPAGAFSHCVDGVLGIEFEIPASWGEVKTRLLAGAYAGYAYYYYLDDESGSDGIVAGGMGRDYSSLGRGGMPWDFAGYENAGWQRTSACDSPGVDVFPNLFPICRPLSESVAWMIRFPNADVLCPGGFENWVSLPAFRIEVALPDNPTINGFVFEAPFFSEQFAAQVNSDLYRLIGISANWPPRRCDEASKQAFDAELARLIDSIMDRTADAETLDKVDELIHVAESIAVRER